MTTDRLLPPASGGLKRLAGAFGRLRRPAAFKFLVGFGVLLGAVVLVRVYVTYRYVAEDLAVDHVVRGAAEHVLEFAQRVRDEHDVTADVLSRLVGELHAANASAFAWIRVLDSTGRIVAESGDGAPALSPQTLAAVADVQRPGIAERVPGPGGDVWSVLLPLPAEPAGVAEPVGGPGVRLAHVGVYLHGSLSPFGPLRKSLALTSLAAVTLIGTMTGAVLLFPGYVRARQGAEQLALAREVQRRLLPTARPGGPELEVAGACEPALEVGGDYYDAFTDEQGRTVLVLADVSGKGLAAGLLAALVHGAVRTASVAAASDPAAAMARLNEFLHTRTDGSRYATLFWGRFDPADRTLRYVNAGHVPPLVIRAEAGAAPDVERLSIGGPVVGLLPGVSYMIGETTLRSGDVLVVYSDGLTEAVNASDAEFGEDHVVEAVRAAGAASTDAILEAVLTEARRFTGSRTFHDDLTVVAAQLIRRSTSA
jgi:hypothetical protein